MSDCVCGFDIEDRVSFAGDKGEISKINHRQSGQCLLHIQLDDDSSKKLPAAVVDLMDSSDALIKKGEFDKPDRFNLRAKAAELDLAHRQDRFVALESNRIDIAPHQVMAAHKILTSYDHRFLIGDEVGLGKTIEAAIVIEELAARGQADRVLIVAPAPLTTQWQEELREKFDTNYVIYDRDYVDAKKGAYPAKNVWSHEDRIITSIDFAKQDDVRAALNNVQEDWDIALFDESHHLTARREGKRGIKKTERYRVGEIVSETSNGLLFLTGTPHNGKRDQFYFMVSLLDPYRFRDEHDVDKEGLRDLMIRRLKRDMYDADGSPMFPEKNIQTLAVEFTKEERQLYDDITEYITKYYNLASREENDAVGFAMVLYQKRLVSSIYAIQQSLRNRMQSIKAGGADPNDLSPVTKSLLDEYREDPEMLTEAQREHVEKELGGAVSSGDSKKIEEELSIVRDLYNQAKAIQVDSKAERLREYINGILEEDPDEKILIFTEYTDTLEYLKGRVFRDRDIAEVYGDLSHTQRQQQFKKFKGPANVMLATDAAREGLNLQFAHMMVNYDLPWNPTRIDQRIGRLHRYGQDQTVEIRNLFFKNTRESIILEQLIKKIDQIEDTLGMSSDVLGLVLENVDLEEQIMSTLATGQSPDAVVENLDAIVEDQKEAVRRVDEDLLIRNKFDLSKEDRDILNIVEESAADTISDKDIKYLVRTVCQEFGGGLKNVRPGPVEDGDDVFDLVVPDPFTSEDVASRYDGATFDRENALADETLEFITLDHPVVRTMMAYCLDTDAVGGQTAVLTGGESLRTPGLLCHYRIGYLSGTGDTVTEKIVQVYVTHDGMTQTENIHITGGLPPSAIEGDSSIGIVTRQAEQLASKADDVAWDLIDSLAQEARAEREREVGIRREHTKSYFEYRIEDLEERIEQFEKRDRGGEDMSAVLAKHRSELSKLQEQKNTEMVRLDRAKQVVPDEPDLVNMAVVVDAFKT